MLPPEEARSDSLCIDFRYDILLKLYYKLYYKLKVTAPLVHRYFVIEKLFIEAYIIEEKIFLTNHVLVFLNSLHFFTSNIITGNISNDL